MVEAHWDDIRGKEVRYGDRTWKLSGDVDVRGTGELVDARARRADGTRHPTATLRFAIQDPSRSPNPGNLGEVFVSLERDGDRYALVVKRDPRTYRYELQSMEYE